MWYPEDKQELDNFIEESFRQKIDEETSLKKIHGLIVPHAGYEYSGTIAGKVFSLLKNKNFERAVILGPSHNVYLSGACTSNLGEWYTPLGKINLFNRNFPVGNIDKEHSIKNQIPFLQKLNFKEIMPLMIGKITNEQSLEIAKNISKIENCAFIFSTDLSHFYPYDKAVISDKRTIDIIQNMDIENFKFVNACGYFPLLILMHLCKILKTKPHLIEYKNSGDIIGNKGAVVGYASFVF
jgi:MEMO1 family protein